MAGYLQARGFVLAELLTVLAVLTSIALVSAPAFQHWVWRDRSDRLARSLLSTFTFARAEALRLSKRIDVCRDDGAGHCASATQRCGPENTARADNWACGWLVTVETTPYKAIHVLRSYPGDPQLTLIGLSTKLSFTPPGGQLLGSFRSFEISPPFAASTDLRARLTRCIRLAFAGRPRITEGTCSAT